MTSTLTTNARQDHLIEHVYNSSRAELLGYITKQIGSREHAEDIVQETFAQLLTYNTLLRESTLRGFIYKIARNLIIDYYRHNACCRRAKEYFDTHSQRYSNSVEQEIYANEIVAVEQMCINRLPPQRGKIYRLCIKEELSTQDVARSLDLSQRTIENHLFIARKELRALVSSFY